MKTEHREGTSKSTTPPRDLTEQETQNKYFAAYDSKEGKTEQTPQNDFDEYMWMGDENADDKILKELEEQELASICYNDMLQLNSSENLAASSGSETACDPSSTPWSNGQCAGVCSSSTPTPADSITQRVSRLSVNERRHKLNPLAAEFVPRARATVAVTVPPAPADHQCGQTGVPR